MTKATFFDITTANKPLIGIFVLFAAICALNTPILVTLWRHGFDDGTYSHAFLVPFISLYLYYQLSLSGKLQFRETLAISPAIPLLISCYLLFVTSNAQISIGYWGALLAVCITSVNMLYKFNWSIVFPAAFLVFILPFWGLLVPLLQSLSITAVTYIMSFTGVPTYVEGNFVTIPAGVFEIADGCSGLRYMIVSLAIGTLFIFLNIKDTKRAILFLSLTIFGALLTNWIRITALILIGEYTNMESSLMEDHNTFGWYLYVPFMILLFTWGGRLASPVLPVKETGSFTNNNAAPSVLIFTIFALIVSSVSLKALISPTINNLQENQSPIKQPQPQRLFYYSVEHIVTDNSDDMTTYNIYSFNQDDLDSKATFFGNELIPKEWKVKSSHIEGDWQVFFVYQGSKNAIVKVSYEIALKRSATPRQFKLNRLMTGLISIEKSKLHWKFILCKTSCDA